jgi:FkbM family methyltransferase
MFSALKRCINRGINIKTVIDVGASDGRWSRECLKSVPSARYLLIEAQEPHRAGLDEFIKGGVNLEYVLAAAGNREGKIFFNNAGLFGGLASESPF